MMNNRFMHRVLLLCSVIAILLSNIGVTMCDTGGNELDMGFDFGTKDIVIKLDIKHSLGENYVFPDVFCFTVKVSDYNNREFEIEIECGNNEIQKISTDNNGMFNIETQSNRSIVLKDFNYGMEAEIEINNLPDGFVIRNGDLAKKQ